MCEDCNLKVQDREGWWGKLGPRIIAERAVSPMGNRRPLPFQEEHAAAAAAAVPAQKTSSAQHTADWAVAAAAAAGNKDCSAALTSRHLRLGLPS